MLRRLLATAALLGAAPLTALHAQPENPRGILHTFSGCGLYACATVVGDVFTFGPSEGYPGFDAVDWYATVKFSRPGFLSSNVDWPILGETDLYICCGAPGSPITFTLGSSWQDPSTWDAPFSIPIPVHIYDPTQGLTLEESFLFEAGIEDGFSATLTPEPATLALVGGGLLAVGGVVRRKRSA